MNHAAALRRRLQLAGGRAVDGAVERYPATAPSGATPPARVIEPPLRHIVVGSAEAWRDDVAFLNGTQHAILIGYVGTHPVVSATVRAAVRLREARRLGAAVELVHRMVVARPEALELLGDAFGDADVLPLLSDDPPHPIQDLDRIHGVVGEARVALEEKVAREFRRQAQTWLLARGSLAASREWSSDRRMIGIVASHGVLPFAGAELEAYLTVPANQRTSVFELTTRHGAPLYAWGLRLHEFAGRDLFHGLVRVEAAATDETLANVDALSRHLLAERAPLANDPRSDRLLYGIHDVERYLRVQGA